MKLNISNAQLLLKKYFKYEDFRENQKKVIKNIVETSDNSLVIMPTGGGKSILYTIPALLFNGLTVIVSPLIALMQDQVLNLKSRNINAEYISHDTNNFQFIKENIETTNDKSENRIKIIFVSPERFVNKSFFSWLKTTDNNFIALDEAHTFTEYGLSFRASYRILFSKIKELQIERKIKFMALTATMSEFIQEDLKTHYDFDKIFKFNTFRNNLNIKINKYNNDEEKNTTLYSKITEEYTSLIYTLSRREAEKIYYRNGEKFKKLKYYHSKLPASEKQNLLKSFLSNKVKVIASTTAFGTGIDKPDVRFVYHAQLPTSIEDYAQQIGRAGRDGNLSNVEMFISKQDLEERKNIILNNKEKLKIALEDLRNKKVTKNDNIKNIFIIRNLVTPIVNPKMEIKILNDLISYPFLQKLLNILKTSDLNNIDIIKTSKSMNVKAWIIEDSLEYLKDKGNIEFKVKKYEINEFNFDEELEYLYKDDNIKINKFNSLLEYIDTKECRHKWLSRYFLNEIDECGDVCDNCNDKNA